MTLRIVNTREGGERIGPETIVFFSTKDLKESVVYSEKLRRFKESRDLQSCDEQSYLLVDLKLCRLGYIEIPALAMEHLNALAKAYKRVYGKTIEESAVNRIMFLSNGHPWIVNRLFSQLTKSRTFQDNSVFNVGASTKTVSFDKFITKFRLDHVVLAADEVSEDDEPVDLQRMMRETRELKYTTD